MQCWHFHACQIPDFVLAHGKEVSGRTSNLTREISIG
jgi:hypothetical protein